MPKRKPMEELTLMDDYMFFQVMRDPDKMRYLLECILHIRISRIEAVEYQKFQKEGYNTKEIRLDLYVTDDKGVIYNVEVQAYRERNLPKRIRFYQSVIDRDVLHPGAIYQNLRRSYIIFFCNYDPFGKDRRVYTFENRCIEDLEMALGDDAVKIIFNTKGTHGDVDPAIRELLIYLDRQAITGEFSKELDDAVKAVKASEERRAEYEMLMIHDMEIREEGREEGKIIGAVEIMRDDGKSDREIIDRIMNKFNLSEKDAEEYVLQPVL